MPLPLPICPVFRKAVIEDWLQDADDRIEMGDHDSATQSLANAVKIYLTLGAGQGESHIEEAIDRLRVKLCE
jgi:hypothetical protein